MAGCSDVRSLGEALAKTKPAVPDGIAGFVFLSWRKRETRPRGASETLRAYGVSFSRSTDINESMLIRSCFIESRSRNVTVLSVSVW